MRNKNDDLLFDEFVADAATGESLEYVELPISQKVFLLLLVLAGLACVTVLGRVGFLTVARGAFYQERSAANMNRAIPIPANRGIITDRNGVVLAKNAETFSVFVSLDELLKDRKALEDTLTALSDTLSIPVEDLRAAVVGADLEDKGTVPLVRNIPTELAIAVRGLNLSAVSVEGDYRREYPEGDIFAHVIGYTGTSAVGNHVEGKTGLEKSYDDEIKGQDGAQEYRRDVKGTIIDSQAQRDPVAGDTIETTIDAGLQEYFYNRMQQTLNTLGVPGGVGLAFDPNTGEVLSLVSLPSFDNNLFETQAGRALAPALFNDTRQPLFNRAISGAYNPGSAIKPLVALAALHEGVVDPTYQIFSKGYIEIPNPYYPDKPSRFVDWKPHGWVDIHSALARSSNVYFYEVGGGFEGLKGLGIERLKEYWQKFGLGTKTGIDLSPEVTGFLPDPVEKKERTGQPWRIGDTYNVSIGQGDLLVSPVQLLSFIASIANGGKIYQPTLVKKITNAAGVVVSQHQPKVSIDYSSFTSELKDVRQGMEDGVVKDYGTSHLLATLPVTVAAKTGSAQIQNNTKTNAFFVGYAPTTAPQIAILVLIENAKEGSLNAVPIAKDVLAWYYENRLKGN